MGKRPIRKRRRRAIGERAKRLVVVSPIVRSFVEKQIRANPEATVPELVKAIALEVSLFRRPHRPVEEVKRLYAQKTAHEIIRRRAVIQLRPRDRESTGKEIRGCVDQATALVASLNELRNRGLVDDVLFARLGNHSYSKFKLDGEWWKANITGRGGDKVDVWRMEEVDRRVENIGAHNADFAEGRDAHDIGLTGFDDYSTFASSIPLRKRIRSHK